METETKQRGGKREGAGRKKTTAKQIGFCATQEVVDVLADVANKSEFICKAILAYKNKKNDTEL